MFLQSQGKAGSGNAESSPNPPPLPHCKEESRGKWGWCRDGLRALVKRVRAGGTGEGTGSSEINIFLANSRFLWKTKRCVFAYSQNVRIPPNQERKGSSFAHKGVRADQILFSAWAAAFPRQLSAAGAIWMLHLLPEPCRCRPMDSDTGGYTSPWAGK